MIVAHVDINFYTSLYKMQSVVQPVASCKRIALESAIAEKLILLLVR